MKEEERDKEFEAIQKIQKKNEEKLLGIENVVGIGAGYRIKEKEDYKITEEKCLTVFVSQKLDDIAKEDAVPRTIEDWKTDVVETGEIFAEGMRLPMEPGNGGSGDVFETALEEEEEVGIELLRGRVRAVKGGYSVGHIKITAGTYATAVTDKRPYPGIPRRFYVLSNNHVLANSNNARPGDPILQPGPYDGGRYPRDTIARLTRFVTIRFGGQPNLVDAAIAEGQFHDLDREIYWIGYVKGVRAPRVGWIVQKTGRTTNYSTGKVIAISATINVNYGNGRVARFVRQTVTTNMSAGGDSGSLLCDMNENAVGLLFAGSSRVTIHNDIRYVQSLLGIRVV
jgi:hypothetical protein